MSKKLLAAALLPTAAFAQQPTQSDDLVITATRVEQPVSSVLAPVNILTHDDIERLHAQTVTEVVNTLPGIEVVSYGGRGQSSTARSRGGSASQTLVLIDGVRSAGPADSGTNLNALPLNQVERIEYIRGARASLYGSDAIGGVINIITRPAVGTNAHKFSVGAGSHQQRQANWSSAATVGEAGQLKVAGGFDDEAGYNVHPLDGINNGDRHGHTGYNGMLDYQQGVSEQWDLFGTLRWYRNKAQYDNSSEASSWSAATHQMSETWSENQSYQMGARYHDGGLLSELNGAFLRTDAYDYNVDESRDEATTRSYARQYNLNWINNLKLTDSWTVGGGSDWQRDELTPESRSYGSAYPDAAQQRDNTGIYALAQFDDGTWQGELSGRSDDNQQYGRHNTWQSGAGWRFVPQARLSARYGTGFRAPTFSDLYYPGSGNPNLKPEESKNSEVMLDGEAAWLTWRITGYRNDYEQMIQWADDGTGNWTPQNVGRARVDGLELEGEFDTGWLSHRLSVEFKDPQNRETGLQLQRIARQNARWVMQGEWGKFDGSVAWNYQGKRYDDAANTDLIGGYTKWDLALGYRPAAQWKISGKVNNLLDKQYETARGYPADGRTYYLTVDYQL